MKEAHDQRFLCGCGFWGLNNQQHLTLDPHDLNMTVVKGQDQAEDLERAEPGGELALEKKRLQILRSEWKRHRAAMLR